MNKNVRALRDIEDRKTNIIINFIFITMLIVPNIINVYLGIKSINEIEFNASEYFINQSLYYIKNIVIAFIFVNLQCFNQIKEYHKFYYLPISIDEFYMFFIQKYKNEFIIITIINLFTFILTTIHLKLNIFILIFNILFLIIITSMLYYVVNILLSFLLLSIPLKLYKNIIKILLPLLVINIIPSSTLKFLSEYLKNFLGKYILTDSISLLIVLIEIILILFILVLKKIKSTLLKKVFKKSVQSEQQSRKYDKYTNINKLKFTSPLYAYISNEVLLIKKGYFKLSKVILMILIYSSISLLSFINALSTIKLNDKIITFIIIYSISIFVDLIIVNYSLNSISFMDDFIEWIKATCLDELIYYRAKLLLKCILNTVIFIVIIASLYLILPIIGISNDKMIIQAIVCYFNIFIMTYFDNNLDFRYQIFCRDTNIKVYIPKIKKYITFLVGKILVITIQLLIFYYLLRSIYVAIVFSYILISIIIYSFKEDIFIHIPIKRPKRKEKYISIDELV